MAADDTEIEYGFQLPDGTIRWGDDERGTYRHTAAEVVNDPKARQAWFDELRRIATSISLNPEWFAAQHAIMSRSRVTTVTDPTPVVLETATQ